jgi:Bacteriophage Sf6, terminase small subunit-like
LVQLDHGVLQRRQRHDPGSATWRLYTRALADQICRRISEGESLRSICRDPKFPSEGSVRAWSRQDRDGFATRFRIARDLQLDCWSDLIVDLADRQDLDPRDRAIRIDTRKWLMSKLAPKRYGERLLHASDPENRKRGFTPILRMLPLIG